MRLSVYISEVVKVNQLNDIVASAEQENPSHQITGVLSYNHGYYLHVVEGQRAEIKAFDKTIRKDPRHQNIRKIFNFETKKRFFSSWSINLAPLLTRNESFLLLVNQLNKHVDSMTADTKRLFSVFHSLAECKSESIDRTNTRDPLAYSINEWPDFNKIEATSSLMSLCGSLMCKPTCFRTILVQNEHESETTLRMMLSQLNEAGYLEVARMSDAIEQLTRSTQTNSKRNAFLDSIEKLSSLSFSRDSLSKAAA